MTRSIRRSRIQAAPLILLAALLIGPLSGSARADTGRKAGKIAVGVFVFPAEGKLSRARQATLLITMENALEENERLNVVDKDRRLAVRAGAIPGKRIAKATRLLERGESLAAKGKYKDAIAPLKKAERALGKLLADVSKRQLARAQFLLGVAYARTGKERPAREWFETLQVWRPDFEPPAGDTNKKVKKLWRAAGKALDKRGAGSLEIVTEPSGALAYVDGRPVGFTPTFVENLKEGTHYVTFAMDGHERAVVPAAVSKGQEQKISRKLAPSPRVVQMTALARAIAADLGEERAPNAILDLGELLSIEHAIFVEVPSASAAKASYRAAVFHTRTRKRLALVSTPLDEDQELEEVFEGVARSLYADLFAPAVAGSSAKGGDPGEEITTVAKLPTRAKPFYTRWWFWTGVAVFATTAVTVPLVIAGGDDGGACPGGSVCGELIWGIRF